MIYYGSTSIFLTIAHEALDCSLRLNHVVMKALQNNRFEIILFSSEYVYALQPNHQKVVKQQMKDHQVEIKIFGPFMVHPTSAIWSVSFVFKKRATEASELSIKTIPWVFIGLDKQRIWKQRSQHLHFYTLRNIAFQIF